MMTAEPSRWIILRTAPRSTVLLADRLDRDGFAAWTPIEIMTVPKTRRRPAEDRRVPVMPTFVFANVDHLEPLAWIRDCMPTLYPGFSIFNREGRAAVIAEPMLRPLREQEQRAADRRAARLMGKRKPPKFDPGVSVSLHENASAFIGLHGVVQDQKGADVLVCFNGRVVIKIDAWKLIPVDVGDVRCPEYAMAG